MFNFDFMTSKLKALNTWEKKMKLIGIMFFMANLVFAGGTSSSGGGAFVCLNSEGQIEKSLLLDLWENDHKNFPTEYFPKRGLTIIYSDDPVEAQIAQAIDKLATVDGTFASLVSQKVKLIQDPSHQWDVPEHIDIPAPTDAQNDYQPTDCPLRGMFLYHDDNERLGIKRDVFGALAGNTQIAASWLHEAIYKVYREHAVYLKNSWPVRRLNACLFSQETFNENCLGELEPEIPTQTDGKIWLCENQHFKLFVTQKREESIVTGSTNGEVYDKYHLVEIIHFRKLISQNFLGIYDVHRRKLRSHLSSFDYEKTFVPDSIPVRFNREHEAIVELSFWSEAAQSRFDVSINCLEF